MERLYGHTGSGARGFYSRRRSYNFYKNSEWYRRDKASRGLNHLALPQVCLGVLAVLAGIVTVFISSVQPRFPFYLGADIFTGVLSVTAGGLAYRISSLNAEEKMSRKSSRMIVAYGCLTVVTMCCSVLSLALAAYVTYWCTDEQIPSEVCLPRKKAHLTLAVLAIVIESFVIAANILCFWKFIRYRHTFSDPFSDRSFIKTHAVSHQHNNVIRSKQGVYIARSLSYNGKMPGHLVYGGSKYGTHNPDVIQPPPYASVAPYW